MKIFRPVAPVFIKANVLAHIPTKTVFYYFKRLLSEDDFDSRRESLAS